VFGGAPSKLQRPAGDRVKTDVRDARHLARLLHLGQIVDVAIPSVEQEAARDLVRAREDCRGDLMTARHRLSEITSSARDRLLRRERMDRQARAVVANAPIRGARLQVAYDAAFDAMLATLDRRGRLDQAITAMAADSVFTPVVGRLGCLRGSRR